MWDTGSTARYWSLFMSTRVLIYSRLWWTSPILSLSCLVFIFNSLSSFVVTLRSWDAAAHSNGRRRLAGFGWGSAGISLPFH